MNVYRLYCVLNIEFHFKVFIYAYLWFKSEFKGIYLASSSLLGILLISLHQVHCAGMVYNVSGAVCGGCNIMDNAAHIG